ncbi:hypothetical protein [Paenibacillus illinoisensis]|uniref:hypothetical protein n=1 Tax=Paenibacillus illinoisensis TaxID=59845 RepID=UPI000FDAB5A2|nr:hypothetical protein [Paenibacillus illinoisensis]
MMSVMNSSSSLALKSAAVILTTLTSMSGIASTSSSFSPMENNIGKFSFEEQTGTPDVISFKNKNWVTEAQELFPEMRDFTKEEAENYEKALDELFVPTGRNFFDLC